MPTFEEVQEQVKSLDGVSRYFGKRELKALPSILWEDERIEAAVQGLYNSKMGMLVATDRRLIFVDKGLFGGLTVEDFPYDRITSIQYETGLVQGKIRVYASGNRADIEAVTKALVQPFAESIRARISSGSSATKTAVDDIVGKIERLGELRAQGVLSDEEFSAAKARLIA